MNNWIKWTNEKKKKSKQQNVRELAYFSITVQNVTESNVKNMLHNTSLL